MSCDGELQQLMGYVRSVVSGTRIEYDYVDRRMIQDVLRQPLHMLLLKLASAGCRIRGSTGNSPREVIELIEKVRTGMGMSKAELSWRSGVSRGHVNELLNKPDPRPLVETVVRLAVGLGFPLEVVSVKNAPLDDADPVTTEAPSPTDPPKTDEDTPTSGWHQAGSVGAGFVGAATVAVSAFFVGNPGRRKIMYFIGASIVAGAVTASVLEHVRARRAARGGGSHAT